MSTPENFVPFMPQGTATPDSVAETLQGALDLLGPNGENWIKGALRGPNGSYCLVGALEQAAPDYQSYAAARQTVKQALGGGNLNRFNNAAPSYSDVQGALRSAVFYIGPVLG